MTVDDDVPPLLLQRPLCFVLMPFGTKPGADGQPIDFDAVYREVIAPAIDAAGLEPLRADEEQAGGIIHKPMFERLILCEYAVADLTAANANVFYELGLRHAVRRHSTVLVFAEGQRLPFDVNGLRGLPYGLGADGRPVDSPGVLAALTERLRAAKIRADIDSPLYQLLQGYPDVQHETTDVFRDRVQYSRDAKRKLAAARKAGVAAVREVEAGLGPLEDREAGVLVDLLLSYRAVSAHADMIRLVAAMPRPIARTVLVREQLGFALNREKRRDEAEAVLRELIAERGSSSETCGLLGRVYKDLWEASAMAGDPWTALGWLDRAIATYLQGFETDWRDAFPGVNAVTLMTLREPPDLRAGPLIPVVRYAAERRVARTGGDYWDHATVLELDVLARDEAAAMAKLPAVLSAVRESWEAETTTRNLRLIREAMRRRSQSTTWIELIEAALLARAAQARIGATP